MNEFLLKLKFSPDTTDVEEAMNKLKSIKLFEDDVNIDKIKEQFTDMFSIQNKIKDVEASIAELQKLKTDEASKYVEQLEAELKTLLNIAKEKNYNVDYNGKDDTKANLKVQALDFAKQKAIAAIQAIGKKIVETFKSAWEELQNIASYSSDGLFQTQEQKQQAWTYGFTDAQNYAFDKAKEMLRMDDDDLYIMNETQRQKFAELFDKYSNKYQKLTDEGLISTLDDFQIQFTEFKEDMELEVVQFFVDNKDEIMSIMRFSVDAMEIIVDCLGGILDAVTFIGNGFEQPKNSISAAEVIASHVNTTNTNNVNINNTFNSTGQADQATLVNAGSMTYKQVLDYLNGGA